MELGFINLLIEIEKFRHNSKLRNIELQNMQEECLYRKNMQNLEHKKRKYFQKHNYPENILFSTINV